MLSAFAQSSCASGDGTYTVASGDTLGAIAARYNTNWETLASYNKLANPGRLYINQQICIPGQGTVNVPTHGNPTYGNDNPFPYGQCTWWAAERFHQLHGIYIPWTTNANAWQWSMRAQDYHWQISGYPTAGAVVVLQPGVQGAGGLGHVATVEQVLGNGHVIASNMNWGGYPAQITNVEFVPGPGVTFVTL